MDTQVNNKKDGIQVFINHKLCHLQLNQDFVFEMSESNSLEVEVKGTRYVVAIEEYHTNKQRVLGKGKTLIVSGSYEQCYMPGEYCILIQDTILLEEKKFLFKVLPYGIQAHEYRTLVQSIQDYFSELNQHEKYQKEGYYVEEKDQHKEIQMHLRMIRRNPKKRIVSTKKKQQYLGKQSAKTMKDNLRRVNEQEYINVKKVVKVHEINEALHYLLHLWSPTIEDIQTKRMMNELKAELKEVPFSMKLQSLQEKEHYRDLYQLYVKQGTTIQKRKIQKNTSALFELYVLLLCVQVFQRRGYSLKDSLLEFEATFKKNKKASLTLYKEHKRIIIHYENDILRNVEGFVNLGGLGAKPDFLIEYYDQGKLLYAKIVEVKCRSERNVMNSAGLQQDILNQCANYAIFGYFENNILRKNIIKDVLVLYPSTQIKSNYFHFNSIITQSINVEPIRNTKMIEVLDQYL